MGTVRRVAKVALAKVSVDGDMKVTAARVEDERQWSERVKDRPYLSNGLGDTSPPKHAGHRLWRRQSQSVVGEVRVSVTKCMG